MPTKNNNIFTKLEITTANAKKALINNGKKIIKEEDKKITKKFSKEFNKRNVSSSDDESSSDSEKDDSKIIDKQTVKFFESSDYPFEKKKKLVDKLGKLTVPCDLFAVKKIIQDNNEVIKDMFNSNGYFVHFHNLSYDTYIKLSDFIKKKELQELKKTESELCGNSESDENVMMKVQTGGYVSKKLRLTNTENHMLNRAKYEKELQKNESNSENDTVMYDCEETQPKMPQQKSKDTDIFAKHIDSKKKK